jgi:hypothetical protein
MKSRCLVFIVFTLTNVIIFMFTYTHLLQTWTPRSTLSPSSFSSMDDQYAPLYSLPSVDAVCPIYTYYQPLLYSANSSLIQILDIWGYAFYAQGFRPVILNRIHAEKRATFTELLSKFSRFPSINPAEYDLNCYLRWIALAEQGGGLLMDYDIMPMASSRSGRMRELKQCTWRDLTTYELMFPMVTHGNASEIEKWVNYMANFKLTDITMEYGKPHTSDMMMAIHSIIRNHRVFTIKSALPFFHYSTDTTHYILGKIKRTAAEVK